MQPGMLLPVLAEEDVVGLSPEVVLFSEPEHPASARLGATRRVMRAEILLGVVSVFGVLTRFSLRSCRRTHGGTRVVCPADSYGESRYLPLRRESTGLSCEASPLRDSVGFPPTSLTEEYPGPSPIRGNRTLTLRVNGGEQGV